MPCVCVHTKDSESGYSRKISLHFRKILVMIWKAKGRKVAGCPMVVNLAFFMFLWTLVIPTSYAGNCSFPPHWSGKWFIKDLAEYMVPTEINPETSFIKRQPNDGIRGLLGGCLTRRNDLFIFRNPVTRCSKCVLIHEKHPNVLYSKEPFDCIGDQQWDADNLEATICSHLFNHDYHQYYWFREDFEAIDCPFEGTSYHLKYRSAGGSLCSNDRSYVNSSFCGDRTRLNINYEACRDNPKAVAKIEEVTCVGTWKESQEYDYLVGEVEEWSGAHRVQKYFRCYVFKKETTPIPYSRSHNVIGYKMGVSGEASCIALLNPDEGAKILEMNIINETNQVVNTDSDSSCTFPTWLTSQTWITAMYPSVEFKFVPRNGNRTVTVALINSNPNPKLFQTELLPLSLTCDERTDLNESFAMLAQYNVKCRRHIGADVCLHFIRRSEYVFQIYVIEKEPSWNTETLRQHCFESSPSDDIKLLKYATLLSTQGLNPTICPHQGRYELDDSIIKRSEHYRELKLGKVFKLSDWTVGCASQNQVGVHASSMSLPSDSMNCTVTWEEGLMTYTILAMEPEDQSHPNDFTLICMAQRKDISSVIAVSSLDCIHLLIGNESASGNFPAEFISGNKTFLMKLGRKESCHGPDITVGETDAVTHSGSTTLAYQLDWFCQFCFVPTYLLFYILIRFDLPNLAGV